MPVNFQDLGHETGCIPGDFVLVASEVNPVARALRAKRHRGDGATQSHPARRAPTLLHAAHDDAVKLARGLRATLDVINTRK